MASGFIFFCSIYGLSTNDLFIILKTWVSWIMMHHSTVFLPEWVLSSVLTASTNTTVCFFRPPCLLYLYMPTDLPGSSQYRLKSNRHTVFIQHWDFLLPNFVLVVLLSWHFCSIIYLCVTLVFLIHFPTFLFLMNRFLVSF